MLKRSYDAEFLNSVVNHPSVKPWVSLGKGDLDLTAAVSDKDNVFLANEFGGFLFIREGDAYDCHTQFLPAGRGRQAYEAAKDAAWFIFTQTDALAIKTLVPRGNLPAGALARRVGFSVWGTAERDGMEFSLYMLTIKAWARGLGQCRSG